MGWFDTDLKKAFWFIGIIGVIISVFAFMSFSNNDDFYCELYADSPNITKEMNNIGTYYLVELPDGSRLRLEEQLVLESCLSGSS